MVLVPMDFIGNDPRCVFLSRHIRYMQEAGKSGYSVGLYENANTGAKTLMFCDRDVSNIHIEKYAVTFPKLMEIGEMTKSLDGHWYIDRNFGDVLEVIVCKSGFYGEMSLSEGMTLVESDYRDYPDLIHLIF